MKNYQPIVYSIVLVIGILIGNNLLIDYRSISNYELRQQSSAYSDLIVPDFYEDKIKINAVIELIKNNYVDDFSFLESEEQAINSIMSSLDPHSRYIPKKDFKYEQETMKGSFSGVGIHFTILNDSLVVVSAISGGPSYKLGIKSADRIVSVDGDNIASIGIANQDVFERLRGEKGTNVHLKVYRKGVDSLLSFSVQRGDIPINSIETSYIIDDNIGYIKVNQFSATTNKEFDAAANYLDRRGMKKLILDLRGNGGGYLTAAIIMCNEFLYKNKLILFTQGEKRRRNDYHSTYDGKLRNIDLAILINQSSASASEIVAGCMQDHDRATIIGKRSFGKGLVQEEIKLKDGSAIYLTTQRYYTPSGRSIQKPYEDNHKQYALESISRDDNERITYPDSLIYKTMNGRTVYGGGGITPDSVIYSDTSLNYIKTNYLIMNNWTQEFSLMYQNKFKSINDASEIDINKMYDEFKSFVYKKDPYFDFEMGEKEELDLKIEIKYSILKNVFGTESSHKWRSKEDEYILKAIEVLNN